MRYLIVCLALLFTLPTQAQQAPAGRRKHALSRAFIDFTEENCFQITRQEADQAFRERSWDDAAALYRAAKSCADANQGGRSTMSLRIRACRDSAEHELLDKERAARRQARQAIASNRADDAQDLLKNFDRGLAYRLADFANQYIAPEGEYNADCLQAMFDAWYYIPQESSMTGYDSLRVPLCYQLPEDGSMDGIIQFAGKGSAVKLYKFSPSNHLFYTWDAQTLRPEKPLPVDTAFANFKMAPDGRMIAFYGTGNFAFWQNGREVFRQKVSQTKAFAFSPRSDLFYYFDPEEKKIMSLDLRPKYVTQSRKSNSNVIKPPIPVTVVSGLTEEPLAFDIRSNSLWLSYADSIVICNKKDSGSPWVRSRVFVFRQSEVGDDHRSNSMHLFPDQEVVLVTTADTTFYYQLPGKPGRYSDLEPQGFFPTPLLGVASDFSMVAKIVIGSEVRGHHLYLSDPATGTVYYGAATQQSDYFSPWQSTFSPDGHWFAATNGDGLVKLWALADRQSEPLLAYGGTMGVARISPDGQQTIIETNGKIEAYPIPSPDAEWTLEVPNKNLGELVVANDWVAYFAGTDSLLVTSPDRRETLLFSVDNDRSTGTVLVAFDPVGKYIAYAVTSDSIVVRHLPEGSVASKRAFSGNISSLNFLPGRDALVVVVQNTQDYLFQQNVIKIWDFANPSTALSTVRLHDYGIQMVAVSPLGDHIAFSDGATVRVFDLDKLDDEQASIRAFNNYTINSLTFQPDGQSLAAGYNNGAIVFWNARTAEFVFEFKNTLQSWTNAISQMAFFPAGNRLRYLDFDNNLFERQLDPDTIRAAAQTTYKQLAAFSPDQILQYNLEPALSYDRNFEVLASSKDGPLIRSFFQFYRLQALSSNNIEQVGIYCKRAFELYKRLDQDFQNAQRQTMLALYEDYSWKWLLRNKIPQSAQVVAEMNRSFGQPIEAVRAGAFTALLSDDLPTATRLFVNWMMAARENTPVGYTVYDEEEMLKKLRQLLDYDLLNADQLRYLCALFGDLTELDDRMCTATGQPMVIPFDPDTKLRWKILGALYQVNRTKRFSQQAQLLESALSDAQTLVRRHPESRLELEKVVLALATSYLGWGDFEQGKPHAGELYRRVNQLLGSAGKFRNEFTRQDLLLRGHLALGNYLLALNQLEAAEATFTEAIKLSGVFYPNTALENADLGLLGDLYVQRSQVELMLGKTDAARTDLETAADRLNIQINPVYYGQIAWLEGKTTEALTQYDNIVFDEVALAHARFLMQRLVENRPPTRVQMMALDSTVRAMVRNKFPSLDTLQSAYRLADFTHRHLAALGQWPAALRANERGLHAAERGMKSRKDGDVWQTYWLDALVSESFYLLFVSPQDPTVLARVIRYAEQTDAYTIDSFPGYANAALAQTNHAHALLLRDGPGDREQAITLYHNFMATYSGANDTWETLYQDFRDLHAAGVQWPRLRELILEIKPGGAQLSADDWRALGIVQ